MRGELLAIAETGRHALADLRRLLDVLGSDNPISGPAIGSLADLAAEARQHGQGVELDEEGVPQGSDELRLAVYRIVQEGLTNARKHAPGAPVQVSVQWALSDVRVRVLSGPAPAASRPRPAVPGSGRGLAGLGDRVARLGGDLRAEATATGGFVLEAFLPLEPARPRESERSPESERPRGDEIDG